MPNLQKKAVDVFFYEAFAEEAAEIRTLAGNIFSFDLSEKTIQESGHQEPPAPLISIRTQSSIPVEWSDKIDGVLSRSTGYNHLVDYRSRIRRHLPLGYLSEYATRAVAEHALLMVVALLRRLPLQMKQFQKFERDGLTGNECVGKNLLIVGVGRIGTEIANIATGLGFTVKGVDIVKDKPAVSYVSKDDGIAWADVIVCAMNLTPENEGYFDQRLLRRAKRGFIFVNIARGEHSPIHDLIQSLEEGSLGGVGLDVYEDEGNLAMALRSRNSGDVQKVEEVSKLAGFPNVILTPHNAFNTQEAVKRKSQMSVEQIQHFLKYNDFIWKLE